MFNKNFFDDENLKFLICKNLCYFIGQLTGQDEFLQYPVTPIYLEKSCNGKPAIVLQDQNYTYSNRFATYGGQRIVWRCSQKYKRCKASCVVENEKIIIRRNFHNHP